MTPDEAFQICRQFDEHAITGNRNSLGQYNSMLMQFHEGQVMFINVDHNGRVQVHIFMEAPVTPPSELIFRGSDPLWLAAVLSKIQSTNPTELTNDQPADA
jgi:hypothetical protein